MLLELPTADEIDDMAAQVPSLTVRRYEFDLLDHKIDLNYTPCKGEVVIVTRRDGGVVLVKSKGTIMWTLPAARIRMDEAPEDAARRVAKERCGLHLTEASLKALYDVTRHYQNVSIKRLFVVYGCSTDMDPDGSLTMSTDECAVHFDDLDRLALEEIDAQAIADCL